MPSTSDLGSTHVVPGHHTRDRVTVTCSQCFASSKRRIVPKDGFISRFISTPTRRTDSLTEWRRRGMYTDIAVDTRTLDTLPDVGTPSPWDYPDILQRSS